MHFGLGVNAQGVGNAVDIIEIGNYFDGVENIVVSKFMFAQRLQVLRPDRGGRARYQFGKLAQRFLARR